ncbi:MAG: SH3 domain-containing protein [Pseudomonadota bacterium]|nr:SH3 domain-containing protein [Pseudomonadota bacterium]
MKKIYFLFACLTIMAIACGTQLPPVPSTEVKQPTHEAQPVQFAEAVEPTESPVIYVTTAPLNVRAEANADSQILGVLEAGQVIVIFIPIPEIKGDDCYMGEWYETKWDEVTAYVCSLYIEER